MLSRLDVMLGATNPRDSAPGTIRGDLDDVAETSATDPTC